jgi:hypothetical protein
MARRTEQEILDDIAKPAAVRILYSKCDKLLKQLAAPYPQSEVDTWAFQLKEAQAYLADPTVPTPFIDSALKDGEDKASYALLIVNNNNAYSTYAGGIVKVRRQFEEQIAAATNIAEVEAIKDAIETI